jgi:predicted secreted protein
MRNRFFIACTVLGTITVLGLTGALAQTGEADPPAPAPGAAAEAPSMPIEVPAVPSVAPTEPPAGAAQALPLQPPNTAELAAARAEALRQQCESALVADAQWRAELKQRLAAEVHQEDARAMLTNRKHVVMAYAALWILVTLFVVFMWMKQRDLRAEIARLEGEIRAATKE